MRKPKKKAPRRGARGWAQLGAGKVKLIRVRPYRVAGHVRRIFR